MTRREQLERLDDRVVPVVAAALRRFLDRPRPVGPSLLRQLLLRQLLLRQRHAAPQPASAAPQDPAGPPVPAAAPQGRGFLALLRSVPQLGLLLAGLVFVVGVLVALDHRTPQPVRPADAGALPVGAAALTGIGPTVGQLAETYLSDTRRKTQRATAQAPDSVQVGLVALTGYLTPQQVVTLVGALPVERVLLQPQVSVGTAAVVDSPVTRVVPDLTALFGRIAARKQGDARDLKATGDSITATTQEETDFKAFYRTALATAEQEIVLYQQGCPCVFMLLLRGRASDLQALEASPQVRAVEFAPVGLTTGQLVVTPLLPGATGPVKVSARMSSAGS